MILTIFLTLNFSAADSIPDCKNATTASGEKICIPIINEQENSIERGKNKERLINQLEYCDFVELSLNNTRVDRLNAHTGPNCWVFWVNQDITYEFAVSLNITRNPPAKDVLPCSETTIIVTRQDYFLIKL